MTSVRREPADQGSKGPDRSDSSSEPVPDATKARSAGQVASERDTEVERRWRDFLELDTALYEQSGVHLLTPEARVLFSLRLSGPVPVTAAMKVAGTSSRGFYAVIERLKQAGLVATVKDPHDLRVRRLSLSSKALGASGSGRSGT